MYIYTVQQKQRKNIGWYCKKERENRDAQMERTYKKNIVKKMFVLDTLAPYSQWKWQLQKYYDYFQ